jgi:hypothetical protein
VYSSFAGRSCGKQRRVARLRRSGQLASAASAEKQAKKIVTTVMQRREGEREIVSFHNAPGQKREEKETGFVIHIEGLKQDAITRLRKGSVQR